MSQLKDREQNCPSFTCFIVFKLICFHSHLKCREKGKDLTTESFHKCLHQLELGQAKARNPRLTLELQVFEHLSNASQGVHSQEAELEAEWLGLRLGMWVFLPATLPLCQIPAPFYYLLGLSRL